MKKHLGIIEIVAIVVLVGLLLWNPKKEMPAGILVLEHVVLGQEVSPSPVVPSTEETMTSGAPETAIRTETTEPGTSTEDPSETVTGTEESTATGTNPSPTPDSKPEIDEHGFTKEQLDFIAKLDSEMQEKAFSFTTFTISENLAFAKVEDSLSVRKSGKWDAPQIGIMAPYDSCIVNSVDGEWANITTGKITGYCRVKYLITGEEAKKLAKEKVIITATTTANVNIRSAATTLESNTVAAVEKGKSFPVVTPIVFSEDPDAPLFTEITYKGNKAYMAVGKITLSYSYPVGKAYNGG